VLEAIAANIREYWLVHSLLAGYTVLLAHHAWSGKKGTKGLADYYVGGRGMGGVAVGLSYFATYSSTNSFVGFSGQAYDWGTPWLLFVPTAVVFCVFAWTVVAPRLRDFAAGLDSLTVPDFIGFRFGSTPARVAAAVIVIGASFLYMTAVFKGIGTLVEVFLNIPYKPAIGIVFVVVVLYTAIGGFISVVKTDVVQGGIMVIAAILLFTGTVGAAGGLGAVSEIRATPEGAPLFEWGGGVAVPVLLGTLFAGLVKLAVEPRQLSRFYALEGRAAARKGMWVASLTFAACYLLLIPVGIYARGVIPGGVEDTDRVVPLLLTETGAFGAGVAAFLMVAMVAAAMSSLDSVLLVTASTAERDLASLARARLGWGSDSREEATADRSEINWTRLWVLVFAAITAVIALEPPGGIVSLTAFSGSLFGACFFPAIVLGLHWDRGSGASVLASFAVGVGVLLTWQYIPGSEVVHRVFPAFFLSLATYVAVALITPSNPDPRVASLFEAASRQ
jgi:SSS family transporter